MNVPSFVTLIIKRQDTFLCVFPKSQRNEMGISDDKYLIINLFILLYAQHIEYLAFHRQK